MKYYAGIGSRRTPVELKPTIVGLASMLHDMGYTLRSGAAPGADVFFEAGAGELKEIFVPWPGFNGSGSKLHECSQEAMDMAKQFHPNWSRLSQAARKLMARNCYQVLGHDLKTPVDMVICWTPNGKVEGGTGQAMRMAKHLGIPIFNLHNPNAVREIERYIGKNALF
jgi:hypothetical protein